MLPPVYPATPAEMADALREAIRRNRRVSLGGNSSKRMMGGMTPPADAEIWTCELNRVLAYEPHDLTISVEAGLPWRKLTNILAANRQMVPLDPPFAERATVGGVVASNVSGPRRRLYGTARDVVIGMQFATPDGKVAQSGGMVVKNVAGLDMSKLMIGSFGTLAAITAVNFKLTPMPELERSVLLPFKELPDAIAARNRILTSVLQPSAIDLLNPSAGSWVGHRRWLMAIRFGGNSAAIGRYERELEAITESLVLKDDGHEKLWRQIEEFTPDFLIGHVDGAVVRVSCTLKEMESVLASLPGPAIARAGSGVCYGYFQQSAAAESWLVDYTRRGGTAVMEFSPEEKKATLQLWPSPGGDFEIMRRIKHLFDPESLLNSGRLYGRI